MGKKTIYLMLVVLASVGFLPAESADYIAAKDRGVDHEEGEITDKQILKLKNIMVEDWLQSPDLQRKAMKDEKPLPEKIATILSGISPDGSWPDIDYLSSSRSNWTALQHFANLQSMALAFFDNQSSLSRKKELKSKILSGIDYWMKQDYQNPNWWYGHIGIPAYYFGPLLLMFQEDLSPSQQIKGEEILSRCNLKDRDRWRSGGNLIYDCKAALHYAVFARDRELLDRLYSKMIYKEFRMTPPKGSGVKEDWSEWEHGNLVYNHGYGALLIAEAARLLSYAHQSGIPVKKDAVDFITNFLLDGSQRMTRGDFLDYSARGRAVSRPHDTDSKQNYLSVGARYLLELDANRGKELKSLLMRSAGENAPLEGNRIFYISDFMTHSRSDFYASVRMFSSRTLNTEICNGENRLGHHLGEGSVWMIADGNEYHNVFSAWNWLKIPGTTVNKNSLDDALIDEVFDSGWFPSKNPEDEGFGHARLRVSRKGRTDFVGGVSDGHIGLACFDMKVLGLNSRKAYFFLDDGMVCLGSGITDADDGGVITTLNQSLKSTPVSYLDAKGQQAELPIGTYNLPHTKLIQHGDFSYLFLEESKDIMCSNQRQMGNWKRININYSGATVETDVFSLWIEHGEKPKDASYAYRVLASGDFKEAKSALESNDVKIISNTKWLQAIYDKQSGMVSAVFYRPGILKTSDFELTVSSACALLYHPVEKKIFIADPTWAEKKISINLNGQMHFVRVDSGKTHEVDLAPNKN